MRLLPLSIVVSAAMLSPAFAQDTDDPAQSLIERGAQMFLEGIMREMEPALDDLSALAEDMGPALQKFADQMGPALTEMLDQVDDWSAYEAPEVLPNGDIIIRRKPEKAKPPVLKPDDAEQIEI